MDKVAVGYSTSVTESEAGWGCRPDGYILGWDKVLMEEWFKVNGTVLCGSAAEYSRVDLPLDVVILTEDGEAMLEQAKAARDENPALRPFIWLHGNYYQHIRKG